MKTIGIIGGVGPESTIDYYRTIIDTFKKRNPIHSYPEIIVYSLNMEALLPVIENNNWKRLIELLSEKVVALQNAGAEFAAIASNTPHVVFEELKENVPLPLVSIVDAVCDVTQTDGFKKVGLFGTSVTMEQPFYKERFGKSDISVVMPDKDEQVYIHQKIFSEIELGIFRDKTKKKLLEIVERMVTETGIEALILGCTELPLILTESACNIPFLNTTAIHCEKIVACCIEST